MDDAVEVDVAVLGAGSAGEVVAQDCAQGGLRVAVVEAGLVGGECPYLACIPSKSLLLSAARGVSWPEARQRRDADAEHRDDTEAAADLVRAGVVLVRGRGRVEAPGRLRITCDDTTTVTFRELVICTGSEPVTPDLPGLADVPTWTSDEALTCDELPDRLVILGGGPVGCELAQAFSRFGCQVTLVEGADRLLAAEPGFVGRLITDVLSRDGVDVRAGVSAEKVAPDGDALQLHLDDGAVVAADRLLLATGRRPRLAGIGLEAFGIDTEGQDGLRTDDFGRVRVNLWAAGDVTAAAPFTHTASYQGRVVAANLLGGSRAMNLSAVPRAVYTQPGVLCVGRVQDESAGGGSDDSEGWDVGELLTAGADLSDTARGFLEGDVIGRVEIYANSASGVVVGAAAVSPHADDLLGQAILAVRAGIDVRVWEDTIQPFPAFAEVFGPALRDLVGRLDVSRASS